MIPGVVVSRPAGRRRRIYAAVAVVVALSAVALVPARASLGGGTAGSKIAFISAAPRCEQCNVLPGDLYVMNAPDGSGQRLVTRGVDGMFGKVTWSPDGRRIGFLKNGVSVVNDDGSGERRLTGGFQAAWSPDGRKIAFTGDGVRVINADGSGERRLARDAMFPDWLPDGRIAFAKVISWRHRIFELHVMNADGSGHRNLTREWGLPRLDDPRVLWSPDSRKMAFTSGRDGNQEIYILNADGTGQRRPTRTPASDGSVAWSPDSQRIAFTRSPRRNGRVSDIYVMNADGSGQRRLTHRGAQPLWSSDGKQIAFRSGRSGNLEVYVMNADGSDQRRLTRNPAWNVQVIAWSPAQR
jgi:Tol biopolymer transport system component